MPTPEGTGDGLTVWGASQSFDLMRPQPDYSHCVDSYPNIWRKINEVAEARAVSLYLMKARKFLI